MEKLTTRLATSETDMAEVRRLCWDYRDHLIRHSQQGQQVVESLYPETDYARLMTRIADVHAPPQGAIRLAELDGLPVGCGMSYAIAPDVAEIKRIYMADAARGLGGGRAFCNALISDIRNAGFSRVVLDTSISLTAARRLYETLGFQERGPFYDVPPEMDGLLCFYEMTL